MRYLDVMAWIDSDASRAFAFQVATQARGTTTVAQLESVTRQAMAGSVDPRAAAVASKNLTWLASVYNRKLYGEQMRVDHRHGLAEDHLAVLKAIVGVGGSQHAANSVPARIAREDRPAIEGQFRSTPDAERQPVQRSAQPIDRSDLLDV